MAVLMVAGIVSGMGVAHAGKECVAVSATTVQTGTIGPVPACPVTAPADWDLHLSTNSCPGIDLIGAEVCVSADIYLPSP
jgi:hypothetical protein